MRFDSLVTESAGFNNIKIEVHRRCDSVNTFASRQHHQLSRPQSPLRLCFRSLWAQFLALRERIRMVTRLEIWAMLLS